MAEKKKYQEFKVSFAAEKELLSYMRKAAEKIGLKLSSFLRMAGKIKADEILRDETNEKEKF